MLQEPNKPRRLQERLLVILIACMTPFLAFAGVRAWDDIKDAREDRRRDMALRIEQSIDELEAELTSAVALLSVFVSELEKGQCEGVHEQLQAPLPSLRGIIVGTTARETCSQGDIAGIGSYMEALRELIETSERGVKVLRSDPEAMPYVTVWERSDQGSFAALFLDPEYLVAEPTTATAIAYAQISLTDQTGRTFGPLPEVQLDPSTLPQTNSGEATFSSLYRSTDGVALDFITTPIHGLDLYAVAVERRLPWWNEARLKPIETVAVPLLVFVATLIAVWVNVDRLILSWFAPLRRMATAYAAGNYDHTPRADFNIAAQEFSQLANSMRKMAGKISDRDADLREALLVKEAAIKETHHRVKNNLQIVNSFVSLQMRFLKEGPARQALSAVKHRIDALSIVHQTLYQHERLETVALQPFFNGLLLHLNEALGMEEANVTLIWDIEATERPSDDVLPLALFVLEAVTNSMKYASWGDEAKISIVLKSEGDQHTLTVTDSGISPSTPTSAAATTAGLGNKLMKAFAKQVNGTFEAGFEDSGYRVTLNFK